MGSLCVKLCKCCCPILEDIEQTLSITHEPPGAVQESHEDVYRKNKNEVK